MLEIKDWNLLRLTPDLHFKFIIPIVVIIGEMIDAMIKSNYCKL